MREHVGDIDEPLEIERFSGGQSNPTFLVRSGGRRWVLRRKPPGVLLPKAHAVDREFRVMEALRDTDVPVPNMVALCTDDDVIGTMFYLMEYVEGRVFWDATLPDADSAERTAIYDEMNRVIAALHQVDVDAVGLGDFGRPSGYLERQIDLWTRQYRAAETERIDAMEQLIAWLPEHLPDTQESSLVHGDYRIDNLIFDPDEPKVLAVLDWELSTLGHPLVDFAYHAMIWRVTPDEFRGIKGFDLESLGIPFENAYVQRYAERTNRASIEHWEYFLAFNMFRMAAILQGIRARALEGNAASDEALETGAKARPMAEAGWRQARAMT